MSMSGHATAGRCSRCAMAQRQKHKTHNTRTRGMMHRRENRKEKRHAEQRSVMPQRQRGIAQHSRVEERSVFSLLCIPHACRRPPRTPPPAARRPPAGAGACHHNLGAVPQRSGHAPRAAGCRRRAHDSVCLARPPCSWAVVGERRKTKRDEPTFGHREAEVKSQTTGP